jgi:hypothetical protein
MYNDKPTGKVECLYESLTDFHQFSIGQWTGNSRKIPSKVFKVFQTIEAR